MKQRFVLTFVMVFLLCGVSHAQFTAAMYSVFQLETECSGGIPLGPQHWGTIIWDANDNGPDFSDQSPLVGTGVGQCNFNTFPLNGEEYVGVPGGFLFIEPFMITTNTPQPSRYYLVVHAGAVTWTSRVITIVDGYSETDMSEGWTCEEVSVPCTGPDTILVEPVVNPNGLPFSECLTLCGSQVTTICLPNFGLDLQPIAEINPGCQNNYCSQECPPTQVTMHPLGWQYDPGTNSWYTQLIAANDGCACFFPIYLPAEFGNFAAIPRDGALQIEWTTLSESDVDYFLLKRDGQPIHSVVGTNTSTGATYSYLDEHLSNGRSYTYTLDVVNLDGSVQAWNSVVNATPSSSAAVITEYALHQNYPNPFNPATDLVFDLVEENVVNLTIYNTMGQEVATLANGTLSAGRHSVKFDASGLTSGVYFYTVKIGNEFSATKKMLLVK